MVNFKLSPHFCINEFVRTSTGLQRENESYFFMDSIFLVRASQIAFMLEWIRCSIFLPISINSAFRCPNVNKAVGGVSKSDHLRMLAVDVACSDMPLLRKYLQCWPFSDFVRCTIDHGTYIHISFKNFTTLSYQLCLN